MKNNGITRIANNKWLFILKSNLEINTKSLEQKKTPFREWDFRKI